MRGTTLPEKIVPKITAMNETSQKIVPKIAAMNEATLPKRSFPKLLRRVERCN